jgi:hypothetical protein
MKKFIIILFLVTTANYLKAQGNLQFNQVINLEAWSTTNMGGYYIAEVNFTVPAGKVWKIEGATSNCTTGNGSGVITLTNTSTNRNYGNILPVGSTTSDHPIWLKSGFTGKLSSSAGSCYYNNSGGFIVSVIEFNIVP